MQIGFNPYVNKSLNNSVSFQAGELNHKFTKRLKDASTNGDDAFYLTYIIKGNDVTYTPERYMAIQNVFKDSKITSVKRYLGMALEFWADLAKKSGIKVN